eukprot:12862644-Ditylum_brightwellii.AAC.2
MSLDRKAYWGLDGYKTAKPDWSTYAGAVSRESVQIAMVHADLHEVNILAVDIQNTYLQTTSPQKHYTICGPEFGLGNIGKRALIYRALYEGKTTGTDIHNHLQECMHHIGFFPCLAPWNGR